jgi:hypothetical protein
MNLRDRFAEWFLAAFDRVMDVLTFGTWTRVRGDVVPNIKVKRSM